MPDYFPYIFQVTQKTRRQFDSYAETLLTHQKPVVYSLLFVVLSGWIFLTVLKKFKERSRQRPRSPDLEKPITTAVDKPKALERPLGVWTPIDFRRPAATPYLGWDIHTTVPLPYRPFRYGPYNISMGLRMMKWDEWIELDNQFLKFHEDKLQRIEERGVRCCKTAPEAFDGALELLEEL